MKEFQSKMQSIFPAIPKSSESSVEWENLLKSKWKTQSHLEISSSKNRSGSSRSVPSGKTKKTQTEQVTDWVHWTWECQLASRRKWLQTKPIYAVLFSMCGIVD